MGMCLVSWRNSKEGKVVGVERVRGRWTGVEIRVGVGVRVLVFEIYLDFYIE